MSTPTLRQLRTFLAVVDTGGVSAAARALNLTQPAASQQIRELERCLRVRLFDRANGQTIPTAAGAALLEPARRAQAAIADAIAVAATFHTGEVGRVRFGSGATACIHLLPSILAEAKRRMPGLEVLVATGNSADITRRVETGDLDIGLVTLPIRPSRSLDMTPIMTDRLVALLPDTMEAPAQALTPDLLSRLPLILYEVGGSTRVLIDAWFRAEGITPAPIMELDSVEAIKALVGGGLGASVLPALALRDGMVGTTVVALQPLLERRLGLVLRRDKVMDRGLRIMRDALQTPAGMPPSGAYPVRR